MRTRQFITVALAAAGLALMGLATPAAAHADPANGSLQSYSTTIGGDPADVYYVQVPTGTTLPFALVLQGANVDKTNYAKYAKLVSSFGFVVIVPNHTQYFGGVPGLYASESEVTTAAAWAATENANNASPLKGKIDTTKMGLLGHSFGGAAGLYADEGSCQAPFCFGPPFFAKPPALKGAAFYGTNSTQGPYTDPIAAQVPTALINGTADGVASLTNAQSTFNLMTGAKRGLVTMTGTNHYGITDTNNPAGAAPDPSSPTTSQNLAYSDIAQWSARWLQASWGDPAGTNFVYGYGDAIDGLVTLQTAG